MNLSAEFLSLPTLVAGWLILVFSLMVALKTAPWHKVKDDRPAQNVWLAMSLIVFLIWQFSAQLDEGVTFHFLLMTMMTLMFGWQFAALGAFLAVVGLAFYVPTGWEAMGINFAIMAWLPIVITLWFVQLSERYLDQNFFVYIFFNGFLAGGVASLLALMAGGMVMLIDEVQTLATLEQVYFPFIPLMAIPEGFVNGMLIAALILLKPHWISSFHDRTHISGK